ncbi:hypothetical protein [Listeria marthii]|uniref:hypothetical protein n=1 Tax=Listeria marthii TaxID=529731 RepID=UPI001628A6EA|nr:hypothetical protein [Listeria marthii]MBC2039948.1 hypothetical protein [Listeria marthii]
MNRVVFWSAVVLLALMLAIAVCVGYEIAVLLAYLPKWTQIAVVILTVLLVSYGLVKYGLGKEDK